MNKDLIKEFLELYHSKENEERQKKQDTAQIMIKPGLGRTLLSDVLGFSIKELFTDPAVSLENQLKWKIYLFKELKDDAPLDMIFDQDYGCTLEATLFGLPVILHDGAEPAYGPPCIHTSEDLKRLDPPDFFKSGVMPLMHEMYNGMRELSGGEIPIYFPGWARSVWSMATILRGFTDIFYDSADDPDFVHQLCGTIADFRIHFEEQRCKFLGISPKDKNYRWKYCCYRINTSSDLFEDEVDGSVLGPAFEREFILPYQKRLSDYYGGAAYYHSCGNLTPFLEDIASLNITERQHISSWTDYEKAAKIMPSNVILQCSLHPMNEVILADEETMENKIRYLIENRGGHRIEICPDALYQGGLNTVNKVKKAIEVTRRLQQEYDLI